MTHLNYPIILSFLISWVASFCHSFSTDPSFVARSLPTNLVRHRHRRPPSCFSTTSNSGTCFPKSKPSSLTLRWNSPTESDVQASSTSPENQEKKSTLQTPPPILDLHPPTLQAIAQALLIRAQNTPGTSLRFVDDGSMEEWEVTLAAGKIAQGAAEEWAKQEQLNPMEEKDEEVLQVMAGRVVAVLTRLEDLEEELLNRCCNQGGTGGCIDLGVPEEEVKAWQANEDDSTKRIRDAAVAIDAVCLFDEPLRYNRARSLLAMFLHEIEGPGLRQNNVVIPCMDVDFLSEDEWSMLLSTKNKEEESTSADGITDAAIDNSVEEESGEPGDMTEEEPARPSLHPITIDAIEDALRLRAQNSTTSPLRLIDGRTEWFEVQYSIMKFADRFLEKYTKASSNSNEWTEEELQTIGGRIVGTVMRLDDLEWEWNHRICTSSLTEADSPSMVPNNLWKTTLGLHAENVEQNCFRTVDVALTEEKDFARTRAERMLALFLLNIETPGLEASGNKVPGGSSPDFIEDTVQLELMMPRPKKTD